MGETEEEAQGMAGDAAGSIKKEIHKMARPTLVNLPFYQCLHSHVKVAHKVERVFYLG